MLGGSVMWGYAAEDSKTIPSLVGATLFSRGFDDVDVVNLAQPAHVLTQELATLLIELRAGRVPIAVIFLDGINDIATIADFGEPGHVFNENSIKERMQIGGGRLHRLARDIVGLTAIGEVVNTRIPRLLRQRNPVPATVCKELAKQYGNQIRTIESLGASYGFSTLFLWQPALATTRKPLSEWEAGIVSDHPYVRLYKQCSDAVERANVSINFMDLRGLFDGESDTVFLDQWGHITEEANQLLASIISDWIVQKDLQRDTQTDLLPPDHH